MCAVHENSTLTKVEKMNYLINLLDGEAEQCVKGMELSNRNYNVTLKMLEKICRRTGVNF